jgi:hypothetical protein
LISFFKTPAGTLAFDLRECSTSLAIMDTPDVLSTERINLASSVFDKSLLQQIEKSPKSV